MFAAAFPIGNALIDDGDSSDTGPGRLEAAAAPGSNPGSSSGTPAAAGAGRLTTATSCADLLDTLIAESEDLIGPWGWNYWLGTEGYFVEDASTPLRSTRSASGLAKEQSSSETGTNVQESGVDEPDTAKTDGEILARIDNRRISIFDVNPADADADTPENAPSQKPKRISTLELPHAFRYAGELLLAGDRLLVIGSTWRGSMSRTIVGSLDVSDPTRPTLVDTRVLDGELLSARLTGDDVRLVTSTGLPDLGFVQPSKKRSPKEAKAQNRELLATSTIEQWLPQLTHAGERSNLLDCSQVEVPGTIDGLGFLTVVGFDVADPTDLSATGVITRSRIVYSSTDRLYLTTGHDSWCCDVVTRRTEPRLPGRRVDAVTTGLHAFALDGAGATYLASGEVRGSIGDRWAMDSADGVLRVATSTVTLRGKGRNRQPVSSQSIVTLGERGGELVELGAVDGLGVNESIQSVRWFDDLAVLVTFRQVDPLYAVDLSDTENPRLLGELKIPGFSSYLHPIGDGQLLGLGTDATLRGRTRGAQASVFDLTDLSDPRRVAARTFGRNTSFTAEWEPRQVTWLPEQRTALAVLEQWSGSGDLSIVALRVGDDGALDSVKIPVPRGPSSHQVRTLPLPDGRVVHTSRASTEFLEW